MATMSLRRIWAPEYMLKDSQKLGEIPGAKQVYGSALQVAGPSIAEYFLISLIMMADTIMVSGIGPEAIAAVGITVQPRFIVLALVLALNVSVTSITAQRHGARDHDGAISCLKQALVLSAVISVVLSALAFVFSRPLLLFAGAQPDTIDLAVQYFRILTFGIPANCVALTISSALRGIGHTKVPMIINMTANLVNVCFNYLLISGRFGFPRLEIRGAAIATIIGWGVSFLMALVPLLHRRQYFYLCSRRGWRFDVSTLRSMYKVASGAFVEQVCMRIGFFIYNKLMANLGTTMYAAHQIALNIMSLSFSVGEGLSLAAASLVGQNLGAKRPDLSIVYGKCLQRMSLIYCGVLIGFFSFGGRALFRLFSDQQQILDIGQQVMVVGGLVVLLQASQMIYMGCLRGAGDTMYVAVISMLSIMVVRPIIAYVLAYSLGFGLIGGWLSFLFDQFMRLAGTYRRFASGKWQSIKL